MSNIENFTRYEEESCVCALIESIRTLKEKLDALHKLVEAFEDPGYCNEEMDKKQSLVNLSIYSTVKDTTDLMLSNELPILEEFADYLDEKEKKV